jgi:hypothetical protein
MTRSATHPSFGAEFVARARRAKLRLRAAHGVSRMASIAFFVGGCQALESEPTHVEAAANGRLCWSATTVARGDDRRVDALGSEVSLRVAEVRLAGASAATPWADVEAAVAPLSLPAWISMGEPFVVGDLRYSVDISRELLGASNGARLLLQASVVTEATRSAPSASASTAAIQLIVVVDGFAPVIINRLWDFEPELLVRARAARKLMDGVGLSRVETTALHRLHALAEGLDELCAGETASGGRCANGPLAEAFAALALERGGGGRRAVESLFHISVDSALRRFVAADDPASDRVGSANVLTRLMRTVALTDAYRLLPTPWLERAHESFTVALEPQLSELTIGDDPLLVYWTLQLVRELHHARFGKAPRLQAWVTYLGSELAAVEAPMDMCGALPPPPDDPCDRSLGASAPADFVLERFAALAASQLVARSSWIVLEDCAECQRALDALRITTIALANAHALGGHSWERVERDYVLPAVAASSGERKVVHSACKNAALLEHVAAVLVLTSRWNMGHRSPRPAGQPAPGR